MARLNGLGKRSAWARLARSKPWREILVYVFIGLWLGWLLFEAVGWTRREDWLFPFGIGGIALGLVALRIAFLAVGEEWIPEVISADEDDDSFMAEVMETTSERPKRQRDLMALLMLLWIGGSIVAFYYLGFFETLWIAIFAFLYAFKRDLKVAVGLTIVYTAFIFILYAVIIKILPWEGRLWLELLSTVWMGLT